MQKIELINTLPAVFAGADVHSEVWHCHVTLERGRRYLVTAESGTGKSSMCSYIYGHRRDYSGTIAFDGADVRGLTIEQWCEVRRRHIAYLPQEMRLFAELTVLENIALKNGDRCISRPFPACASRRWGASSRTARCAPGSSRWCCAGSGRRIPGSCNARHRSR